jgi:hypothetical protein
MNYSSIALTADAACRLPAFEVAASTAVADARPEQRADGRQAAPFSIWRRIVLAEAAQVELDLHEAQAAASPYGQVPGYDFGAYLVAATTQLTTARQAAVNQWPMGLHRRVLPVGRELVRVWTGSEHETAVAALHRAEGLYLMIAPEHRVRAEALKIEAIFKTTNDIPMADPRHGAYSDLFARTRAKRTLCEGDRQPPVDVGDRLLLREVRREQNEAWEIARCRVRIFRNILSITIPLLSAVLVVAAILGWRHPNLIPLMTAQGDKPGPNDIATVEFLGAMGGLLSAVATLRAARNFQRFYGLPLAQSILKIPAGAISALAGVLLVQHRLLGSIGPFSRETIVAYALLFGVAQIAVTKQIDTRAGDLLGEANAKSPSTAQNTSGGRSSDDA